MVGEKHEYAGSEHGLVVKREAPSHGSSFIKECVLQLREFYIGCFPSRLNIVIKYH
jgi:hypothetical protein